MSIIDNLKKDLSADANKVGKTLSTDEGRKWFKYGVLALGAIIILSMGSCMLRGCVSKPQPQPMSQVVAPMYAQPAIQPVYQNNSDPMVGVIAGMAIGSMMSNGTRYDGHNGYMDSRYSGPPQKIVNKPIIAPVTPVVANPVTPSKNAGDAVAIQERTKMAQEAQQKANRDKAIAERKSSIQKQRSVQSKSNFSSFAKKGKK